MATIQFQLDSPARSNENNISTLRSLPPSTDGGFTFFSSASHVSDSTTVPDETQKKFAKPSPSREHLTASKEVAFDGPADPENPKNWTVGWKWAATFAVSLFTLLSPISSSIVAPAIDVMSRDLHVEGSVQQSLMLSIFVLAYAIGPLIFGPLSEIYGRVPVLQLANLWYLFFNLGCGFAQNGPQMLVCRFFAGLGGSAPLAIGGGVLSDCWTADQRGRAIAAYSLAPMLGPAIGPIAGAFITAKVSWRWIFYATCIFTLAVQCLGLFLLRETYAPKLLAKKAQRLRKQTGDPAYSVDAPGDSHAGLKKLQQAVSRPFIMMATQPIIIALAVYMAYLYGLTYLVLASFARLYTSPQYYHERVQIGGLHYIALALGFAGGAELTARINDFTYGRLKARHDNVGRPEFRAPVLIPCAVLLPIGFFWFGWTAETHQPWILPDIGATILAAGIVAGVQSIQSYVVDAYARYAASGMAAIQVLRSLAGFSFPLFAPTMYDALGYGWGNSILGIVAIVLGAPAPLLLWKFGGLLRAKSRFAAGD